MFAQQVSLQQVHKYAEAEGLSSYNVRTIFQDKKGFIWVATQNGLNRFDGVRFLNYTLNSENRYRICGVDVRAIVQDEQTNRLWTLANEGGFNAIDLNTGAVVQSVQLPHVGADEWGMSMVKLEDRLWLGLSTGLRIYNTHTNRFEAAPILPPNIGRSHNFETTSIVVDNNDNIWAFFSSYGVVVYNGKTKAMIRQIPMPELFHKAGNRKNIRFNSCMLIDPGRILIGTSQGLSALSFTPNYHISLTHILKLGLDLANGPIESVNRTATGKILVASHSQLYELDTSLTNVSVLQESDDDPEGNWLNAVQCTYIDRDNNYWLGCQQGLALIKGQRNPFRSYYFDKTSRLKLNHVRSIFPLKSKNILVGLRNGIATIEDNRGQCSIRDRDHLYHHIFEDTFGRIHVSTPEGLFIYTGRWSVPITKLYPEFSEYEKTVVNSHLFAGDSMIVLGTENEKGILLWNYKRHTVKAIDAHTAKSPLAANIVNNIFRDSKGRLWVLSDHVITITSPDDPSPYYLHLRDSTREKDLNLFFDVTEAMGSYWVASYGNGVIELDKAFRIKRILSTAQGLSNDGVYQIFYHDNRLVITTDNGLSVWSRGRFKNYYREDGLHSNSFEEVAGVKKDGLIYAGGVKGFTLIDPSEFSDNNIAPLLYITRIVADRDKAEDMDTTNTEMQMLRIPNDVLQTRLFFSGINYRNASRTSYSYRILEHNEKWVDIGTQHFINLIGLPPGEYHIEVKAANEDGLWSKPTGILLVYLPKWYQTWWFKGLILLGCFGLAYAFYRMRIVQILKQQKIRKDVASDLHDDIGSSLNSVKVFAHLAMTDPSRKDYIQHVEQHLQYATVGLRDMIWVLDDRLDSVDDLSTRLLLHATRPAEAMGIRIQFDLQESVRHATLSKQVKRNLFLIAKEAINNSVKYAGCHTILVSFRYVKQRKLSLTITDDGKGFDAASTTQGYGLSNIKSRAEQIYFDCEILSDDRGTNITLTEQ